MKIKKNVIKTLLIAVLLISPAINAQDNITAINISATGCTNQAVEELLKAINQYRADTKNWNSNTLQPEFTLGGVTEEQKGVIELPVNKNLMLSANQTAVKFADGTYPQWDHIINGEGPTMRAIKNGWKPSMNKLFYANEEPVFTMLSENLFEGSAGYTWKDVFEAWKNSPGHNTTLLSRGAVSIGCGCSDTKANSSGEQQTYWVLLVELENSITESDAIMEQYFKEGLFFKRKNNVKRSELSKYTAVDAYEFIDDGIIKIKD